MKHCRGIPILQPDALRGEAACSPQYIIQFKELERDAVRWAQWKSWLNESKTKEHAKTKPSSQR